MIICDFSQIAMSTYFVLSKEGAPDIDTFRHSILNSIRLLNKEYRSVYGDIVICCDGSYSWRKKFFPYYKAKRAKRAKDRKTSATDWDALFKTINHIRDEFKTYLPYVTLHINSAEADDAIATLVFSVDEKHIIISADKDFVQLQMYKDVVQYDPINEKWVRVDDPKRHLFDRLIKGDSSDGIPNIFSDDDTFMVEGKRQKRIMSKKLDEWYESDLGLSAFITEDDAIAKYNRNKKLIDLRKIPSDIVKLILEQYQNQKDEVKTRNIMTYFTGRNVGNLLEKIGDFR